MKHQRNGFGWLIAALIAVILLLGSVTYLESGGTLPWLPSEEEEEPDAVEAFAPIGDIVPKAAAQDKNDIHLRENKRIYESDEDLSIVTLYMTIYPGNQGENTDHTWEEVNYYSVYDYERMGVERYKVSVLLQVGDENGPIPGKLGYGENTPNATVQVRGQTSSKYAQKNYKIELKDNRGTWRNQRTLAINKHMGEGLRFRNKLAYDLLEEIPQLVGLRTQFMRLYVRDLSGENPEVFEDYGLYTQVEQLNGRAMRSHGLDHNGHLYKINFFEFFRYEDTIRLQSDPAFDATAFNALLEIKGDTDHTKLIRMLEDLNNMSIPIDTVLEKHFDRENLVYWLAFQILIGNADTEARNVYLYSPQNIDTWYLIPWDHDSGFMRAEYSLRSYSEAGSWQVGITNYWGNILFQRCLKSTSFRAELDAAIHQLMENQLNPTRIAEKAQGYASLVKPYVYSMPDVLHAQLTSEQYDEIVAAVPQEVTLSYQLYQESLQKPMPFYIGVPYLENGRLVLGWDAAFDLDAQDITYSVELARDCAYQDVIYHAENVLIPEAFVDPLPAGQYFLRVRATNADGYTQDAFDYYVVDSGKVYSTKCFYVLEDGSIVEDVNVEG